MYEMELNHISWIHQKKPKPCTRPRSELLRQVFRGLRWQRISHKMRAPMSVEKIKILGAVLELPAKQ